MKKSVQRLLASFACVALAARETAHPFVYYAASDDGGRELRRMKTVPSIDEVSFLQTGATLKASLTNENGKSLLCTCRLDAANVGNAATEALEATSNFRQTAKTKEKENKEKEKETAETKAADQQQQQDDDGRKGDDANEEEKRAAPENSTEIQTAQTAAYPAFIPERVAFPSIFANALWPPFYVY